MESRATSRMASSLNFYHKGSDGPSFERNKFTSKRCETKMGTHEKQENHDTANTVKKLEVPVSSNVHRKSDTLKQSHGDGQDKGFEEPYVREYKEFPGVTITIRAINNPRAFANLDPQSKANLQNIRRRSDNQPQQINSLDKVDHADKTDHTGASNVNVAPNNTHDA